MPPPREETFFKGKDTTNTNFDPDISYSNLSAASKTSEPHHLNCLIASEPPIDKTKGNNKASLLTLPFEIRLQIYSLLLIVYSVDLGDGRRYTQPLEPGDGWLSREERRKYSLKPRMGTGIMQTCRQIYHEASSIFYSQNRFLFYDPDKALRFIEQIGPVNLKLIKALDIHVNHTKEFGVDTIVDTTAESPVVRVLDILADGGNRLWVIEYYWTYLTDDGELRKSYLKESSRRHAELDIRALEKIRFQGGNWAIVNIKFRGN